MKTDSLKIVQTPEGIRRVLDKVELMALYADMSRREATNMTLLAEEMLLAMGGILETYDGELWMELDPKAFSLHLRVDALTDSSRKEKLIALSTSGKNAKPKGFFGAVSAGLEAVLIGDSDAVRYMPLWRGYDTYGGSLETLCYDFDYTDYTRLAKEEQKASDEWDGLEKTLIDALADDLSVSVRSGKVELTAVKKLG